MSRRTPVGLLAARAGLEVRLAATVMRVVLVVQVLVMKAEVAEEGDTAAGTPATRTSKEAAQSGKLYSAGGEDAKNMMKHTCGQLVRCSSSWIMLTHSGIILSVPSGAAVTVAVSPRWAISATGVELSSTRRPSARFRFRYILASQPGHGCGHSQDLALPLWVRHKGTYARVYSIKDCCTEYRIRRTVSETGGFVSGGPRSALFVGPHVLSAAASHTMLSFGKRRLGFLLTQLRQHGRLPIVQASHLASWYRLDGSDKSFVWHA
jgi:hypothetical protein